MDNANKALIMAGSTLVAIMLFTLFVVFLRSASVWPEAQDEMLNTEQIAAFNAEYEVYQKSAMYGVDVISCLNKAYSNNDDNSEDLDGDGESDTNFFTGEGGIAGRYKVNVIVQIKEPLKETITVTAVKSGMLNERQTEILNDSTSTVKNFSKINLKLKDVFEIDETKQLTDFSKNDDLKYNMSHTNTEFLVDTKYNLEEHDILKKLIKHSTNVRQIIKNPEDSPDINYIYDPEITSDPNDNKPSYGWVSATWDTYLYSFKQKRFKCEKIEYSNKTGRIVEIEFIEI